jgi:murein DD-endopeptidase MepM/ murein hydrolase activator NlpD
MKLTRTRALVLAAGLTAALFAVPADADEGEFTLVFPQPSEDSEFVDSWGNARSGGRRHQGTDILAPQMTPIVAAADGVVERFGNGPRSGYYIVIKHRDGYETWYMHMNNDTPGTDDRRGAPGFTYAAGLAEGDPVEAGQLIGYVGDSGNAEWTTHHTHFELHLDGRAINPYRLLTEAWERWQLELQIEREEVPFR